MRCPTFYNELPCFVSPKCNPIGLYLILFLQSLQSLQIYVINVSCLIHKVNAFRHTSCFARAHF